MPSLPLLKIFMIRQSRLLNKIHIGGNLELRQYEKEDGTKGIWVQILLREFEYCEKKEQQAGQPKQEAKKEQVA